MAGSEGYAIKLRNMQANLDVDRRQLARIDNPALRLNERRDMLGRSREELVKAIAQQERILRIARAY